MNLSYALKRNAPLRNLHAGKRCFVVGNGPSLKEQNILPLKDEVTIVVSSFFHHPQVGEVNPPFWFIADPKYWEQPEDLLHPLLDTLAQKSINTKLFMPSGAVPAVMQAQASSTVEPHFYHYDWGLSELDGLDFCRGIPPLGQNVVIPAMLLALYMGCSSIYLIGCDHSWWGFTPESYANETSQHFYAPTGLDAKLTFQSQFSFEALQRTIEAQRHQYRMVKEYANQRGAQVFNATRGGYMEDFPRVAFEDLFPAPVGTSHFSAFQLGRSAIELALSGSHDAALVLVEKALGLNYHRRTWVDGLEYVKAVCLARLGRIQEAATAARTAIHRASHTANWAKMLLESGPDAAPLEPRALRMAGQNLREEQQDAETLLQLGERYFAEGHLSETLDLFYAALGLEEDHSTAHNNLAVLLWHIGQPGLSERHFGRALELDPHHRDALLNWVEALQSSGDFRRAKGLCMEYLATHPEDGELRALLGDLETQSEPRAYRPEAQIY